MDSIITPYQNAVFQGRNITNNILVAHVILDILRKKKGRKNYLCTKNRYEQSL